MEKRYIFYDLSKAKEHTIVHDLTAQEHVVFVLFATGGVTCSFDINLQASGSVADIIGVIIGGEGDSLQFTTLQHHEVASTLSDLLIKTVLTGNARFNYTGIIRIDEGAQKSNAYQRNDNLLLSSRAHAQTSPALEILANDVRCTHGATIGSIDDQTLFYLQSRGISKKSAEKMVIGGYIQTIIDRIEDKKIQNQLMKKCNTHMSSMVGTD